LFLEDNNLRGNNSEIILKAICACTSLEQISLKNNFLGNSLNN